MNILMEVMGITAMLLILSGYFLISSNKVDSRSPLYQSLNVIGSIIFVIYLSIKSAWAAVALNAAWTVIGLFALYAIFKKKKKEGSGNKNEEG